MLDIAIFILARFVNAMHFEFMFFQRFWTIVFSSTKFTRIKLFSLMNQTDMGIQLVDNLEGHSTLFACVRFCFWMKSLNMANHGGFSVELVVALRAFKIFNFFMFGLDMLFQVSIWWSFIKTNMAHFQVLFISMGRSHMTF